MSHQDCGPACEVKDDGLDRESSYGVWDHGRQTLGGVLASVPSLLPGSFVVCWIGVLAWLVWVRSGDGFGHKQTLYRESLLLWVGHEDLKLYRRVCFVGRRFAWNGSL